MEYIRSQNEEEYKKEMADLYLTGARLVKNPKAEIKSSHSLTIAGLLLSGIGLFLVTFGLIDTLLRGKFTASAAVFFIFIYIFFILYGLISLLVFNTRRKIIKRRDSDDHFDCDKEGLIFITSQGERKTYWDNYQAIRTFTYTMVFIPRDRKGMYLLAPVENLQNVTSFLEENGISIEVIRQ